jgi:predicted O-methyltransferase YrrM
MGIFSRNLKKIINMFGYDLHRLEGSITEAMTGAASSKIVEATLRDIAVMESVRNCTMTSDERLWALISAVSYVCNAKIEGDFVECGVWRGGSSMAMALKLIDMNQVGRHLWLYDTFQGMTEPTNLDREAISHQMAGDLLNKTSAQNDPGGVWCLASRQDVELNMQRTGYPAESIKFVEGDVLKTLERRRPEKIALLRLDTDWYESTKMELEVLFPLLQSGGVCIIDDYGHWEGARKAVDEYLHKIGLNVYMHRVDYTGRAFVKP